MIVPTGDDVAHRAAELVVRLVQRKPDAVLGLATGGTPVPLYRELIRRCAAGEVSFRHVRTFNLDEYVGLPPDHPQSYRHFMQKQLFDHIDVEPANTHVPAGDTPDPTRVGEEYERLIGQAGGIDLQILGIGSNGHVGFNEPTSSLLSRTRIKSLTEQTMADNRRFFAPDEVQPRLAITMGLGTILDSRRVLLLATGRAKADAVQRMIEGPLTSMCPASVLQLHKSATVLVGRDAAGALDPQNRRYFEWVSERQDQLVQAYGDPRE